MPRRNQPIRLHKSGIIALVRAQLHVHVHVHMPTC